MLTRYEGALRALLADPIPPPPAEAASGKTPWSADTRFWARNVAILMMSNLYTMRPSRDTRTLDVLLYRL